MNEDGTNVIYKVMRRRACSCKQCMAGKMFQCVRSEIAGKVCGPCDLWKNQKESEWQKDAMEEFSSMNTKIHPNHEQDPDI